MKAIQVDATRLLSVVTDRLEIVDVLLDIGCGIKPQQIIRPMTHICCEPCSQYIDHLLKEFADSNDRSYVIINAGWQEVVRLFPPDSVDTVVLIDVIEHLEKSDALFLLKETEGIARRQVAVFTPLGYMPQSHDDGKDAWGLDGGEWQEHKSGWSPEDFGGLWEVFVADAFHNTDNLGNALKEPFGAMWAILTKPGEENCHPQGNRPALKLCDIMAERNYFKNRINTFEVTKLLDRDFSHNITKWVLVLLHLGLKIKHNRIFVKCYRSVSKCFTIG